ncbi:hypothetical protein HPB51_026930 [Rhipicephalus microplus]|uniref:CCHC-type domain-containing protein n=1 Tax=Rhipicephalus microplus TaxID=6941 RepID=A0A9J6D1Z9_RHIMP|nr:hypothetical protein HPB51_026930 [Rhipicephalus microplus]
MYCYGEPLKYMLYKKRYEVCYLCGQLGHRSDVCISDHVHCRGCGMTALLEDHACEPKCKLCGKGHLTADRKCKEAFRTPYTIKKRQWEAWRRMEGEERKAKDADPQTCRIEEIKERSRSRSKNQRGSRGGAGSFTRLPERQEGELPPMTGPVNEGTSGSAVLNSGRPTSPNLKIKNIERPEEQSTTPPPAKKRAKEVEKPVIDENVETVIDMKIAQLEANIEAKSTQDDEWQSWEALLCSPDPNVSQALAAAASQGIPADS